MLNGSLKALFSIIYFYFIVNRLYSTTRLPFLLERLLHSGTGHQYCYWFYPSFPLLTVTLQVLLSLVSMSWRVTTAGAQEVLVLPGQAWILCRSAFLWCTGVTKPELPGGWANPPMTTNHLVPMLPTTSCLDVLWCKPCDENLKRHNLVPCYISYTEN